MSNALPAILDLVQAKPLLASLTAQGTENAIVLDAGAVERLSTPCAQVLLSAGRTAAAAGASFQIVNASAAFRTALAELGLQPAFSAWID